MRRARRYLREEEDSKVGFQQKASQNAESEKEDEESLIVAFAKEEIAETTDFEVWVVVAMIELH